MRLLYLVFAIMTGMCGYTIHSSMGWAIIDCVFAPLALIKWLIYHELTLSIIKETFTWFFV